MRINRHRLLHASSLAWMKSRTLTQQYMQVHMDPEMAKASLLMQAGFLSCLSVKNIPAGEGLLILLHFHHFVHVFTVNLYGHIVG